MNAPSENKLAELPPALSRVDLWPIVGILIVALVLYMPLLFGRPVMPDTWERYEPWNSELGFAGPLDPQITNANNDAILMYIPWNRFAHDELRAGRIPAWDPYCLCGVPLASNHLVPVFYPIYTFIAWAFAPLFIMGVSGLVHTLIMAIFFYLFLREWLGKSKLAKPYSRIAAWVPACFLVVSLLPNPHYQPWPMTLAWFPAIWFFYERWLKHRSPWAGLWMALCWAGPLLAGYPSLFIQMSLFTAVWILIRPNMMPVGERPRWASRFAILIWPFVLALGLSAVQNIPTVMASMESERTLFKSADDLAREASFTVPANQPWQMHVKRLLQPMIPFRFPGNDFFNRGYVGIVPVMFALYGLAWLRRKEYPGWVFLLALIIGPFALVPALNFLVYRLTGGILIDPNPPVEVFGFLVLMLMGAGLQCWRSLWGTGKYEGKAIWALIGPLITIVCALAIWLKANPDSWLIPPWESGLGIVVLLGMGLGMRLPATKTRAHWLAALAALFLIAILMAISMGPSVIAPHQGSGEYRDQPMPRTPSIQGIEVLHDSTQGRRWGRIVRFSMQAVNVLSLEDQPYLFYPNLGTYFGIPDVFGYHNLAPASRFEYLRSIQEEAVIERRGIVAFTDPVELRESRLGALGVRYILSDCELPWAELILDGDGFYLYERPASWALKGRLEVPQLFYVLRLEGGDWYHDYSGSCISSVEPVPVEYNDPVLIADEPGHIVASSNQETESVLVVNEGYANGWRATIDGEPVEVHPFDWMRMAVDVPPGEHVVEFYYVMPGLKEGWILTGFAGLLWVLLGIVIILRKKSRADSAT